MSRSCCRKDLCSRKGKRSTGKHTHTQNAETVPSFVVGEDSMACKIIQVTSFFFMFLYTWPRTSKAMTRLLHTFMPCIVLCFLRQHVFVSSLVQAFKQPTSPAICPSAFSASRSTLPPPPRPHPQLSWFRLWSHSRADTSINNTNAVCHTRTHPGLITEHDDNTMQYRASAPHPKNPPNHEALSPAKSAPDSTTHSVICVTHIKKSVGA